MFKPVDPKVDIQEVEMSQLKFWRENRIFHRTMEEREGSPSYVFYEGPPTANGIPGSHHVLSRAFKDIFPRYKTMRGFYSYRKGGWDTHGLPVEIAIQKELGIEDKREIVEYGIDKFNQKCKESVFRNIKDWERMTERMAYWVDLSDAYVTFTNDYIESIWHILKQFWMKGLLYQGLKVVPYSPKSGTPLSSHEVSLGYKEIKDPSVYVRFAVKGQVATYLLAWTTTPWTLPSNTALAVGRDLDYVKLEGKNKADETEYLILCESLINHALTKPEDYKVVERYKGADLLDMEYTPLYTFFETDAKWAYVLEGDFVSTTDGTGIVHIAPAYGVDDMRMGDLYNLPVFKAVEEDGRFVSQATPFVGVWFKDADEEIIRDLRERGLLYRKQAYTHNYPHDWRTGTPLMYFARKTWFIRTTEYKQKLIDLNQTINWEPAHIKDGRFGNWLEDLKDWALGRERFWGTPLPIWLDDQTGEALAIGSVAELSQYTGRDLSELDLHRPYVDEITFPNPNGGGGIMRRVPEVIDVWFDSGAMPLAQWGYPAHNQERFATQYPADYICEAVDQTRGWFYSLHAISVLLNESVAYKNVISLGHILDEENQKMSKSKGNVVDPWVVFDTAGADALRWYCYTSNPPGEPRRFALSLVNEVVTKFYLTLWNTYSFFVTYANIAKWTPAQQPPLSERDPLDQWVIAELNQLVKDITEAFETYDVPRATRPIQAFVDELSNWYVRLSRRRFWEEDAGAFATLYEALVTVAKLIAPAMPFLSDEMYRNLVKSYDASAADSVHLTMWPSYDEATIQVNVMDQMRTAMRLVSMGRAARENVNIGVRQPLMSAQFVVRGASDRQAVERLGDLIMSELNVKSVSTVGDASAFVTYTLNPLPQKLGRKFGKDFPRVQAMLRDGQPSEGERYAKELLAGRAITIELDGSSYEILPDECEVKQSAAQGYALVEEAGYVVALDVRMTDDLMAEGLSREVVRRIQSMRKSAGFEIEDRIRIQYLATERLAKAMRQFSEYIQSETLATEMTECEPAEGYYTESFEAVSSDDEAFSIKSESFTLGVIRLT